MTILDLQKRLQEMYGISVEILVIIAVSLVSQGMAKISLFCKY